MRTIPELSIAQSEPSWWEDSSGRTSASDPRESPALLQPTVLPYWICRLASEGPTRTHESTTGVPRDLNSRSCYGPDLAGSVDRPVRRLGMRPVKARLQRPERVRCRPFPSRLSVVLLRCVAMRRAREPFGIRIGPARVCTCGLLCDAVTDFGSVCRNAARSRRAANHRRGFGAVLGPLSRGQSHRTQEQGLKERRIPRRLERPLLTLRLTCVGSAYCGSTALVNPRGSRDARKRAQDVRRSPNQ